LSAVLSQAAYMKEKQRTGQVIFFFQHHIVNSG